MDRVMAARCCCGYGNRRLRRGHLSLGGGGGFDSAERVGVAESVMEWGGRAEARHPIRLCRPDFLGRPDGILHGHAQDRLDLQGMTLDSDSD
jgi:hypothetical protein